MATVFSTNMKGPLAVQRLNELWALQSGAAIWGEVIGTIADQTDLSVALNAKASQSALNAAIAAAFVNPMTAAGDLIVGGAMDGVKATPRRLVKGAEGQVLMVVAGALAWVTPQAGLTPPPIVQDIACSDETTPVTVGTGKITFRTVGARTLIGVRSSAKAVTGAALIVDINKNGASILSTKLSIDAGEESSVTAAAPVVITDTAFPDNTEITIDFDQVGSTSAGKGVKVYLIWRLA
jgi:hypothetical protein